MSNPSGGGQNQPNEGWSGLDKTEQSHETAQPAYPGKQYLDPYSGAPLQDPNVSGQPYPSQPYPGQPYPSQPYPGQPYPQQPYGSPYPMPPQRGTNGMAIGSLVTSIACLLVFGGIGSFIGAILGHVALGQIKRTGEQGRGLAIAGIIIGWVATALWLIVAVIVIWILAVAANTTPSQY
jgi:hypothetical protein